MDKKSSGPSVRDWYIAREFMKLRAKHSSHYGPDLIGSSEARAIFESAPPAGQESGPGTYSDLPDWGDLHDQVQKADGNEEILDPIEQFIYEHEPGDQFHREDCAIFRTQLAELIKFVEAAESLATRAKLGKFIQAIDRVEAAE